jgi:PAS domain S-box-containing protein
MESLNRHSPSKASTILIVDDDPAAIDALRRILRRNGYGTLIGCSRPEAALDLIAQHRPNLIMLDLHMPGMDGFDVLAHIQQNYLPEEAPITLVVTAADDRASRLRALESGARDYLLKPYDPYEVLLRVHNLLDIQLQGRMLGSLLDATPVAMLVGDADGRCTYINRSALNLLGYEHANTIIGQDIDRLLHHSRVDASPLPSEAFPVFARPESKGETYCRCADGRALPVSYWSYPLSFKRATGETLLTLMDRREVRRHAEELEAARRNADVANQAKSRFVANMSHEIRTPLTAIAGFAETLTEPDQTPAKQTQAVNAIIRNSRYLMELVDDILDLSKIESGKLTTEQMETDFAPWIRGIADFAIERARAKELEFDLLVEAPWPRTFITDPTRAKQILVNLLSNAFKFTEQGSVRLRVRLDGERLVCEVIDTGTGIESPLLEEVFEAFVQADASTMREHGGSGLGLNIARTLSRRLGGDLSVRSVLGVGSQFTVTLATGPLSGVDLEHRPLHLTRDEPAEAPTVATPSLEPSVALHGDVLLVDDHADNRDLLTHLLHKAGVRVFTAENGQLAFQQAQHQDFDLILMDMQMPVLDGLNATRLLRMSGFDSPIIALTANTTPEDKQAALEAGCNDFLTKPIDHQRLHGILVRYLSHSDRPPCLESELPAIDAIPGYESLRDRFRHTLPESLAAMRAAQTRGDLSTLATLSHQLRGVGSSFGFEDITRLAERIETKARQGDAAGLAGQLDSLEELCHIASR